MNIPNYVWKSAIILLSISELRRWIELYKSYYDISEDNEMPESIKHLYN